MSCATSCRTASRPPPRSCWPRGSSTTTSPSKSCSASKTTSAKERTRPFARSPASSATACSGTAQRRNRNLTAPGRILLVHNPGGQYMRCFGRVVCALLLIAAAASAQLKETIDVHLVEVPVTVIDRNGDPIRGLTAANFEIIDQGKKREIKSFDKIDFNSAETVKTTSSLNPNARRSFLLLFDLSFSSPLGRQKAEEAARNFIARGMQRRDLAAIATVDINHGFRMVTAFTTDKTLLTAAITNPITFVSSDPLQIAGATVFEVAPDKVQQGESNSRVDDDAFAKDVAIQEKRMHDTYDRSRIERQVLLLTELAKTLRQLPGRKQVMFFSEGFDPRLVQGRDARDTEGAITDMQETTAGNYWRVDSDSLYGNST